MVHDLRGSTSFRRNRSVRSPPLLPRRPGSRFRAPVQCPCAIGLACSDTSKRGNAITSAGLGLADAAGINHGARLDPRFGALDLGTIAGGAGLRSWPTNLSRAAL